MRDQKTWEARELPRLLDNPRTLTPRLRRDVQAIPQSEWLKLPVQNTYIWGPVGYGKTIDAAFTWIEAKRQAFINSTGGGILFTTTTDLIAEIQETFDNKDKSAADVVLKYQAADVLVLDDLGSEKMSDWVYAQLYLILNYRYEYLLTTVITSNYNLEELAERLNDERIPRRIEDEYVVKNKTKQGWKK